MKPQELTLHHGPLAFSAKAKGEVGSTGPIVLCLHGFPDNANSFRHQLPFLADAGYRAVSVTLRGYEPQSQPADNDYSTPALASDVIAWIDELGGDPVHLVGHDWGAGIAYAAGAAAPEKFHSITTMSVPHSGRFMTEARRYPKQLRMSWYMGFFQLGAFADWATRRNDFALIRRLWRNWSPTWKAPDAVIEDVLETFRQPGVLTAALDYYRTAISPALLKKEVQAASRFRVPVPTLTITGADDGCIDTQVFEDLIYAEDFPAGHRFERIEGAGHFPHQERPAEINALLLDWISSHDI